LSWSHLAEEVDFLVMNFVVVIKSGQHYFAANCESYRFRLWFNWQ
jgi:hypothetical protein